MAQVKKTFSITGSMFRPGATALIERLRQGQMLSLIRESNNKYDSNAVLVCVGNRQIGYLPRGLAAEIAPVLDSGRKVICRRSHDARFGVCDLAYVEQEETTS
jgi:hypothetical protein